MTHIKYGEREDVRESTWLICEAAKVLSERGAHLDRRDQEELLSALQSQAQRLSDAIEALLGARRHRQAC